MSNNIGFKKMLEKMEFHLRVPQYYKRTWINIVLVTIFLLALAATSIIIIKAPTDPNLIKSINSNASLANAGCILSYISFGIIAAPYIFLSACWIVGIDNITKSKNYHFMLWIFYTFSSLVSIIAIIISFRSYIIV